MEHNSTSVVEEPARRQRTDGHGVRTGIILVILGVVLLASRFTDLRVHNWWALFILIPAFGSLESAWQAYRNQGSGAQAVWGGIYGALFPTAIALIFLLDLSWMRYWPVFLIIPGLGMVMSGLLSSPKGFDNVRVWLPLKPWLLWCGLALLLLGVGFYGQGQHWFALESLGDRWWAWCLLLPAVGGIWAALSTLRREDRPGWAVWGQLLVAAVVALPGLAALSSWDWSLVAPLLVIALGCVLLLAYYTGHSQPHEE
jgi:hypothetical protein